MKLKPIKVYVSYDDDADGTLEHVTFYREELPPNSICCQNIYCGPNCTQQGFEIHVNNIAMVGGRGYIGGNTSIVCNENGDNREKCPICGVEMDWDSIAADDAASAKAFDDWFNANATDGSLAMINDESTGCLQEKRA